MAVKPSLPAVVGPKEDGQMKGGSLPEKFGEPRELMPDGLKEMNDLHDDIGEKSGFQTEGYLDKKGTCYGEAAKFNFLPPGMDIEDQVCKDIRKMPFKKVVDISYPGDGWEPAPRAQLED